MCGFVSGFCLTMGLYVSWVSKLWLSVCQSEKSYVWRGVCLFVRLNKLCLAWGLSVRMNKLCLARGLSVCPSEQVMFGMRFVCLSV